MFKQGDTFSIPQRIAKVRENINKIQFIDIITLITVGMSIYTMSPLYLIATVTLLAIREAKDFFVKTDTENKVKKMEESVNLNMLSIDERVTEVTTKIEKLNKNQVTLDKRMTEGKNEMNRFILQQKQTFGLDT